LLRERIVLSESASADESNSNFIVYFRYILECSAESFYVGVTSDPQRRMREHNEDKGAK